MIFVICGPTCSGKTEIANKIAAFCNCPIINADAFQIYQEMNIGTAKLSKEDSNYKKYHLLDIVSPSELYSVKQYQDDFRKCINELLKTNNHIVVCGGTGLYIKSALYDYEFEEEDDFDMSIFDNQTPEQLYEKLKELDPKACEKVHMNNVKRVKRALAIALSHTETKSENIDKQKHDLIYKDVVFLMISPDREKLYEHINSRVDLMFEKGLVDEVKSLLDKFDLSVTSKEAIGYKETIDYLNGNISLEECKELIKKRTRNYAKRQVTFFKNQMPVQIFETAEELIKEAKKYE